MRTCILIIGAVFTLEAAHARTWTDVQGRKIEAEHGGSSGDTIKLKLSDGREVDYPLAKLSAEDRAFVAEQNTPKTTKPVPAAADVPYTPRDLTPDYAKVGLARAYPPLEKRMWPMMIVMGSNLSVPKQISSDRSSATYRLGRFQFETGPDLSVPLVKEVARVFAGIEELFERLPWDLPPTPPESGYFIAKLYPFMSDYMKIAPAMSGGFYSLKEKVFHVPYESLGMTRDPKGRWSKTKAFNPDTLMHELAHMMMDRVLPALPIWVAEGSAEYVETIPLEDGALKLGDMPKAIKTYISDMEGFQKKVRSTYRYQAGTSGLLNVLHITRKAWEASIRAGKMQKPGSSQPALAQPDAGSKPEGAGKDGSPTGAGSSVRPVNQPEVVAITASVQDSAAVQHDLYMHSCLLFYYFMHLDNPARRGDPMLPFLDNARDFTEKIQLLIKAEGEYAEEHVAYRKAWESFANLPGVKRTEDNRISYPSNLVPPKAPEPPRPPVDIDKLPDRDVTLANLDLLIRGRTDEQLAKAFRDGFARIGITLN